MTRYVHVVRSLRRETGGLAEAVRQLAHAQRRRGDALTVVSLDPADRDEPDVVCLGRARDGYGFAPEFVPWLQARAHNHDAVVVHGLWQYQGWGAWRALRRSNTPYIVFPHGMLDVWFKRAYPLKHAKKWLYWPWAEYRVLSDAAAVCYTAEEERRRARQCFWLYRARERICPIGIADPAIDRDAARAALFAAFPEMARAPFLLFLGRVHPKKGVDLLLEGYAAAYGRAEAPPRLVIAGPCTDEAYRQRLVALAGSLRIADAVTWLPMISGDVKWGALSAAEAFVLFSHQENFGVAVVEALAMGLPVLLSDQIAISRDVESASAGLVGPDSSGGAANTLARWRELSSPQREAMSAAARMAFTQRYVIDRAAESLAAIVAEVRVT